MIMKKCVVLVQHIFLIICISTGSVFIYFHWYLKSNNTNAKTAFY